jgi:cytoskeletal protein RodZ
MTMNDDDRLSDDGVNPPETSPARRRTLVAAGVVGLAAVLGAGAYVVTSQGKADETTVSRDTAAMAPSVSPQSAIAPSAPAARGTADAVEPSPAGVKPSASATASLTPDEQVAAARSQGAKAGRPVQRAVTDAPGMSAAAVNQRTEPLPNGTVQIITSKSDLTGHQQMEWAGDKGVRIGEAHCTQKVKFTNNAAPAVRPNLIMCWRTSAKRSVVTLLVDQKGKPSASKSAEIIAREWAKLG